MMLSTFYAYHVSIPLVISIKGMFVECSNARKVMQKNNMVNPFRLNRMETQDFSSAKPPTTFCGPGPAV